MLATIALVCTIATTVIQLGTLAAGAAALLYSPSIAGLIADAGIFDIPFINGISYFVAGLGYARGVAYLLAQLFCVIGLVWNAFKLWAGAEQIKKTVISIGARLIIFSFVFNWYASITMNLLGIGTGIGEMICGGKVKASEMYDSITNTIFSVVEGYDAAEMANFNILKNKTISNQQFDTLLNNLANGQKRMTFAEREALKQQYGIKTVDYIPTAEQDLATNDAYDRLLTILKNKMALLQQSGKNELSKEYMAEHAAEMERGVDYDVDYYKDSDGKTQVRYYKLGNLNESYNSTLARFNIIAKFFGLGAVNKKTGETEQLTKDMVNNQLYSIDLAECKKRVADWFSGLWLDFSKKEVTFAYGNKIKDKMTLDNTKTIAGFNPQYLSPGAIVKIGSLLAELLRHADDTRAFEGSKFGGFKIFWYDIISFVVWLINMLVVEFTTVFLAIDYIMMILEYHIVTTISYIFLPLMLFDGTRQYAMKLVGTFMGFFVRILVFTVIFYFCLDTYLQMLLSQFTGLTDPGATQSFSYILLSSFICLILTHKVPQIAQTILSGSPSMGAGDAVQAMRGALHGGMMGVRGGMRARNAVAGGLTKGVQAGGRVAANGAIAGKGGKMAYNKAVEAARAAGTTDEAELKQIGNSAKDSWLHSNGMSTGQRMSRFVGNLASQAAFGIKDNFDDMKIGAGIGKGRGTSDHQKLTVRNMMDGVKESLSDKNSSESQPSSEASKAAEQKPIGKAEGKAAVRAGDTGAKSPDYPETAQGGSSGMTGSGTGGAGSAAGGTEAAQKKPQPDSKRSSYTPPAQATQGGGSTQKPASNGVAKQQSGNTAQKPSGSRPKSSATPKHPQSGGKPYSRKSGNGRRK